MMILIVVFDALAPCGRMIYQYLDRILIKNFPLLNDKVTYFSHDAIMKNIGIDSHYTYAMSKVLSLC